MAKVQMSVEELLHLIKGETDFGEAKKAISERIIDIWAAEGLEVTLKDKAEEMARRAMKGVIENAFKVHTGWGSRNTTFSGWAVDLVKEQIQHATIEAVIQHTVSQVVVQIQPQIEKTINEVIGKLLIQQMSKHIE